MDKLLLAGLAVVYVVIIGICALKPRIVALKTWSRDESRFLVCLLILVLAFAGSYSFQIFWTPQVSCIATQDIAKSEYLIGTDVDGEGCEGLIGKITTVAKERRSIIRAQDVRTLLPQEQVLSLNFDRDTSLSSGLVVGHCLDVWSSSVKLAAGAVTVAIVPYPTNRRLVFLDFSNSDDVEKILQAAKSTSTGGPNLGIFTIVGVHCVDP